MASTYNKAPPLLSTCKSYNDWKKLINLWTQLTTLDKNKQGPALVLSLDGKSQDAALEIESEQIAQDDGVKIIIKRLDKIYEKDKLTEKYNAIEKFETYRRPKGTSIRDFLTEFDKRFHKTQSYKTTMSDDLLAYRLLKAASLDSTHEKLIKATVSDLIYDEVRTKLIKIFSDDSSIPTNEFETLKIKEEPTFYGKERFESTDEDEKYATDDEEGTYFTKRSFAKQRPRADAQKSVRMRNFSSSRRENPSSTPNWRHKQTSTKVAKNPIDRNGRISRCSICESVNHWQQECPDNSNKGNDTYIVHEIILHHNENKNPTQLKNLVAETWNCGMLDCGASKTVCGENWLTEYTNSLSEEEQKRVKSYSSKSQYRFGDGEQIQAVQGVRIPAYIGNTSVEINTDVVTKELPLLLSKSFMKRANMVIDFHSDKASALGEQVNLTTTTSGHYIIPLTKPTQLIRNIGRKDQCVVLVSRTEQSNQQIAMRLHRQFAHPRVDQLLSLINKAGHPWNENKELKTEIVKVSRNCQTCQVYQKPPPRPVVGLPMATKFLETVAMDLKFYHGKIILHLIDMCTRLSAATMIRNKHPDSIVKALFQIWISVYGSTERFLMDNGGEFANNEVINLAEKFGIVIKTTAGESPWSNGIVERHNLTLANMLDKVLNESNCDFEIALAWCVNAKNSLANVHGFSPYQLAIGSNPQLPSILTDKEPALTVEPATKTIADNLTALHKAREAFIESEHSERIRRALSKNIRTSSDTKYVSGDLVYYKRKDNSAWHGPGTVLGQDGQQILIKHSSYYVRVHPCRVKLVRHDVTHENNKQAEQIDNDNQLTNLGHSQNVDDIPEKNSNQHESSSDDNDCDRPKLHQNHDVLPPTAHMIDPNVGSVGDHSSRHARISTVPADSTQTLPNEESMSNIQRSSSTKKNVSQNIKLKPNLQVKYKDVDGNWVDAKVTSRAGKLGGKHEGWWNMQRSDGIKEAVDFTKISDIEIKESEKGLEDILLSNGKEEVKQAKLKELTQWKVESVYDEIEYKGQECISLRWVVTPKVIDGVPSVKARLVAGGFEEVQNFRTDSPTCSREGIRIALTLIASNSWELQSLDVKTAFLQGNQIEREVYVIPPKEANTEYIWKLKKTVYGLADASRSWYLKLRSELLNLGAKTVQLDQGIFVWFEDKKLKGIMACFVDDVIWAGNEWFKHIISKLRRVFKIGTENSREFSYVGLNLKQIEDKSIIVNQNDYISSLEPIIISADRLSQDELCEEERTKLRGALGQLNWLSGMTRPEISFTVSEISSRIKSATISDIKAVNKSIKFVKTTPSQILIPKLDLQSLTLTVYTDASFNNLENGYNQGGHLVLLCDKYHKCTTVAWSSNKLRRVARSTLAAETLAFTEGTDVAYYMAKLLAEILPSDNLKRCPIECFTDSRSLFEAAGTSNLVNDRRLRVEISAIREMVHKDEIVIKWIEKAKQLSDVLTKKGASAALLMETIQSGKTSY